jgi:hypothetical protein
MNVDTFADVGSSAIFQFQTRLAGENGASLATAESTLGD